jgi:type I restriction enzyme S subunit
MNRVVLSSIIDIISGGTPKTTISEYWNGDIGWLSVTDFNDDSRFVYSTEKTITEKGVNESNTKFLNVGDIIISARGTVGALAQIGTPLCFNQSCFGLRGKKGIANNDYLYYSLKNYVNNIKKRSQGSVFDTINLASFDLMELDIHKEISTQKAIAKVLSDLDAKIELNNKINQELEAMAKTLYDYWFVQFDFPNEQGKPYKSSGGKMVYNEELKREIPEGWEVGTLKNISELIRGVSYSKNDIRKADDEGVIPILRATNITENVIDLDNMVYVPNQFVSSTQILNKYDILITMSSGSIEHIGKNGFFYFDKKVAFGAFCAKLVAKKNFRYYLYSYTQSDFMFATIKNECLGTNINNLNSSLVNGFKTIIPPEELIEKFNTQVKNIYDKIANNQQQNQQLTALRDWLLPMLMNGQITVGEAEEKLNMAAEPKAEYKKG